MFFHAASIAGIAELISAEFVSFYVCSKWWLRPLQGYLYADLIAESAGLISTA